MKEMESQTKTSLKLQAYQYLKTKILNCEYRPNEFLNEQKLCAEMGNISRTPLRDALGRLEQEGLITILPKKGLMVSGITEEDVPQVMACGVNGIALSGAISRAGEIAAATARFTELVAAHRTIVTP